MRNLFSRYSPARILLVSFIFIILVGTLLLSTPLCSYNNVNILDALFAATSAACVTGLLTINLMKDLTLFGQIVILLLIQVGGLGLMSFVTLSLDLISKNLGVREWLFVKDSLNKSDLNKVSDYLKMIFIYTFVIEFVGFVLLLPQFYNGSLYSIFQSLFLSISAFCNAGMDIFGGESLLLYQTNLVVNIIVGLLIILGGLGFAVIADVVNNTRILFKIRKRLTKSLKFHTQLVLTLTGVLVVSGFLLILVLEYNNALLDLSLFEKLEVSLFNSITLRTAGFATFNYQMLRVPTKILMLIFMVIGASPGGTGGGLKTTTAFLLLIAVKSQLSNRENMCIFSHHVKKINFIKAQAIFAIYFICIVVSMIFITCFETIDSLDLMFEVCSAIGTVGLTCGITPIMLPITKVIIILLMFIGRLGPITVAMSFGSPKKEYKGIKYPSADIIVG